MKDIKFIFKIMAGYPLIILGGILCLIGYAVFGGVSITFAKPVLDYVFLEEKKIINYNSIGELWNAITPVFSRIFSMFGDYSLFSGDFSKAFKSTIIPEFNQILLTTNQQVLLTSLISILIIFTIIKNVFFIGNKIFFAKLRGLTVTDIRYLLYKKYLYLSLAFHKNNSIGDSQVRMTNDVKIISNSFLMQMLNSVREVVLVGTYLVFALFINVKLFLLMLMVVPFFSVAVSFVGKKIKKYAKRTQNATANIYSRIEEILNYIMVVKSFSQEEKELEKYHKENIKLYHTQLKSNIYNSFSHPLSELNATVIGVVVILVGGNMILSGDGDFTFGSFATFLALVFSSLHPIKTITKAYNNMKKAVVSIERVREIAETDNEVIDSKEAVSKKSFNKQITFKDVSFKYNPTDENEALRKVNLTINKGERAALVGSSGSGKTTLTLLLNRLYDPTSGDILLDDVSLKNIKLKDLRHLFGVVTQESMLFQGSIRENISYGLDRELADSELEKLLKKAHAYDFVKKMDGFFEAQVQAKGGNLSGGQKQRLCIARAIAADPPVLIFDEATSALDTESERQVQLAMEDTSKNRTTIMIAHRLSTILSADKIVVMENGEIIDIGNHQELLKKSARYKYLYDLQFSDK